MESNIVAYVKCPKCRYTTGVRPYMFNRITTCMQCGELYMAKWIYDNKYDVGEVEK